MTSFAFPRFLPNAQPHHQSTFVGCPSVSRAWRTVEKPRNFAPNRLVCVAPQSASRIANILDPSLASTALSATTKLLATTAFGVLAAARGLLEPSTLQALSKTVFHIFLPSLLLTNVTTTLASGVATELLFLPIAALCLIAIGLVAGVALSRLLRLDPTESRIFLVCCGFANSAALPLLFAKSLFDDAARLAGLTAGISFYLLGWTGLFWSLGYAILTSIPGESSAKESSQLTSRDRFQSIMNRVCSPPLIGSLVGVVIGCLPVSLRSVIIASPVFSALRTLGAGYVPTAILVLAGSLSRRIERTEKNDTSPLRVARLGAGIFAVRFLMMPLAGLGLVRVAGSLSPMSKLTLLLESVMPPAMNSTVILTMEKRNDAASAVARVLLVMYLLGVIPICVGLSIFLGVSGV